jgi:serine protease Do
MSKNLILKPVAAAVLGAGLVAGGSALALKMPWDKEAKPAAVAAAPAAVQPPNATAPAPAGIAQVAAPNYRAIVQQFGPAVVGITVEGTQRTAAPEIPPGLEPFFRGMPGFGGRGGEQPFRGQGSGFIVSADGTILTNAHVVDKAKEVTVKLSDRREFRAKVLGVDTTTDIAVLKIDARNLPVVRLGDPKQLFVGDPVLAIGAPYGLEQTATQGIVSAKGRSLPGDAFVPFIQTDAAVNPGNSGGPLFDGAGNVVGINSQIYSRTGGFQGVSFAIPIDVALKVKDQIAKTGKVQHARLGVGIQDLTQPLAESFGLPAPDGALVSTVAPDSAAAKAGIKPGDVITEVNGEPVVQSGALSSRIGLMAPGDKVKLKVWRDKQAREVTATLGRVEDTQSASSEGAGDSERGRLGLALAPARGGEGLVVQQATGPAARAGVQQGDVLVAINGQPVKSVEQIQAVLKGKPKTVALLIERDGDRIFVPVNLG